MLTHVTVFVQPQNIKYQFVVCGKVLTPKKSIAMFNYLAASKAANCRQALRKNHKLLPLSRLPMQADGSQLRVKRLGEVTEYAWSS